MAKKKDVILKDNGDYIYPLAHMDDEENVIKETYLNKTGTTSEGGDLYLKKAEVIESSESGTKLVLTDQDDEEVEFISSTIAKFG